MASQGVTRTLAVMVLVLRIAPVSALDLRQNIYSDEKFWNATVEKSIFFYDSRTDALYMYPRTLYGSSPTVSISIPQCVFSIQQPSSFAYPQAGMFFKQPVVNISGTRVAWSERQMSINAPAALLSSEQALFIESRRILIVLGGYTLYTAPTQSSMETAAEALKKPSRGSGVAAVSEQWSEDGSEIWSAQQQTAHSNTQSESHLATQSHAELTQFTGPIPSQEMLQSCESEFGWAMNASCLVPQAQTYILDLNTWIWTTINDFPTINSNNSGNNTIGVLDKGALAMFASYLSLAYNSNDGKVYAFGGYIPPTAQECAVTTRYYPLWRLDLDLHTWEEVPALNPPCVAWGSGLDPLRGMFLYSPLRNRLVAYSGSDPYAIFTSQNCLAFDFDTSSWLTLPECEPYRTAPPVYNEVVIPHPSGSGAWMVGGVFSSPGNPGYTYWAGSTVWYLDFASFQWSMASLNANLPEGLQLSGSKMAVDTARGHVYVWGGLASTASAAQPWVQVMYMQCQTRGGGFAIGGASLGLQVFPFDVFRFDLNLPVPEPHPSSEHGAILIGCVVASSLALCWNIIELRGIYPSRDRRGYDQDMKVAMLFDAAPPDPAKKGAARHDTTVISPGIDTSSTPVNSPIPLRYLSRAREPVKKKIAHGLRRFAVSVINHASFIVAISQTDTTAPGRCESILATACLNLCCVTAAIVTNTLSMRTLDMKRKICLSASAASLVMVITIATLILFTLMHAPDSSERIYPLDAVTALYVLVNFAVVVNLLCQRVQEYLALRAPPISWG